MLLDDSHTDTDVPVARLEFSPDISTDTDAPVPRLAAVVARLDDCMVEFSPENRTDTDAPVPRLGCPDTVVAGVDLLEKS